MSVCNIVYGTAYRIPTIYTATQLVFPLHISVNSTVDLGVPEECQGNDSDFQIIPGISGPVNQAFPFCKLFCQISTIEKKINRRSFDIYFFALLSPPDLIYFLSSGGAQGEMLGKSCSLCSSQ